MFYSQKNSFFTSSQGKSHGNINLAYVFPLIWSSLVDICELSLKARMRGSMKLVMLSSDNFFGGAAPVATYHVDLEVFL